MLKYALLMSGVYILLLSPWWIRNWLTFHEFILFTNSGEAPSCLEPESMGSCRRQASSRPIRNTTRTPCFRALTAWRFKRESILSNTASSMNP